MSTLSASFRKIWPKLMTKSTRGLFSNQLQGDVLNSNINDRIWQSQPEALSVNQLQENVTLTLIIRSGQYSNLSKISSMSTLSASFRNIWSKLNKLCWWQSQTSFFFSSQGDVTLRLMIKSGQFLKLSKISSISILSAKFQGHPQSYGDDKHFPVVSLWNLVIATTTSFH